jgi:uncharacterized protein (TIGR02996 family)
VIVTSPDYRAFCAAIREQPDEDTPRLALADWLDEQEPESVPCPSCVAILSPTSGGCWPCKACGAANWEERSFVTDTSARDRAELIRVQVELANLPPEWVIMQQGASFPRGATGEQRRTFDLLRRESALLTQNETRWRAGPVCEECKGKGGWGYRDGKGEPFICPDCWNGDAGGLMRKFNYSTVADPFDDGPGLVRVTYDRGLPVVTVPRAADVWWRIENDTRDDDGEYRPTKWLAAVCRSHPDVTEIRFAVPKSGVWVRNDMPSEIYELLRNAPPSERDTVLARAVVQWVHTFSEAKS